MKIIITENQLKTIILKEQEEKKCLPEKKEWNEVDYSVENIEKGDILNIWDKDTKDDNALKKIQVKLGLTDDGKYGTDTLEALAKKLNVDICKQKNNNIPVGKNTIKSLGIKSISKVKKEDLKDFSEDGKSSEDIKEFIKSFEKLKLKAYDTGDGMITVGWGHAEKKSKSQYKVDDKITLEKAKELFKNDIETAEKVVTDILSKWKEDENTYKLTQPMFDALVSLAYNSGRGTLRNATVKGDKFLLYLKNGDYTTAGKNIKTYALRSGFSGLIDRRKKEYEWFCKQGC